MNTNSNAYTVIYTTLVVVVVAAVLAFTAMKLKPSQEANAKAETLRQMMSAAQIKPTDELYATNNAGVLQLYADNIDEAYTIGLDGQKNGTLSIEKVSIELVDNLKPQNKAIKAGGEATLPVYVFKNGYTVIPVYGAGLWGPVWGYIAFQPDCRTIAGAYFDQPRSRTKPGSARSSSARPSPSANRRSSTSARTPKRPAPPTRWTPSPARP